MVLSSITPTPCLRSTEFGLSELKKKKEKKKRLKSTLRIHDTMRLIAKAFESQNYYYHHQQEEFCSSPV